MSAFVFHRSHLQQQLFTLTLVLWIALLTGVLQAQLNVATVKVGGWPTAIAANQVTNKVYVANVQSGTVSVIDGTSNAVTTVTLGRKSGAVAINSVTNKVYVANPEDDTVSVIDGASNAVTAVEVGIFPKAIAVNPVTNKVYVANFNCGINCALVPYYGDGAVSVIDGTNNAVTSVNVGRGPVAIAVNSVTNKTYVANLYSHSVSVIDEGSSQKTSTEKTAN